jgi:8-amino-7-oxononanoate synthase
MGLDQQLEAALAELGAKGLLRRMSLLEGSQSPEVVIDGHPVVHLSTNNYLGLADHPAVAEAAKAALDAHGVGAGGSRLINGNMQPHEALEAQIASFKGTEDAVLFNSGYHANLGTLQALLGPGDTVLSDALNHASIIDGCRLSRADVHVFRHRDLNHLEELLRRAPATGRRLIVSDTVFSMDGDLAPLAGLCDLAEAHGAFVMVDEAHATGVIGPGGRGLCAALGVEGRVAVQMGTLGKAIGVFGAYVAGSQPLCDFLRNRARSFVFTTALPPAVAAAASLALGLAADDRRRVRLRAVAGRLRQGLEALGWEVRPGDSPILPVLIGDPGATVAASGALLEAGVFARGIRPPTVPAGTGRLRVTVTAAHTDAQIDKALRAFSAVAEAMAA